MADAQRLRPDDREFADATHARWTKRLHRDMADPRYRDDWYAEQCGGCRFWIALTGILGSDYGGCSNADSPCDGTVRFEHDGCEAFEPVAEGEWGSAPR